MCTLRTAYTGTKWRQGQSPVLKGNMDTCVLMTKNTNIYNPSPPHSNMVNSLLLPEIEAVLHYSEIQTKSFFQNILYSTLAIWHFASWAQIKTLFHKGVSGEGGIRKNGEDRSVLSYRSQGKCWVLDLEQCCLPDTSGELGCPIWKLKNIRWTFHTDSTFSSTDNVAKLGTLKRL